MINRRIFIAAGAAAFTLPGKYAVGQDGAALRIAIGSPITSVDPHFFSYSPNIMAHKMIYDPLVQTDADLNLVPCLAESWTSISDTIWEFKLRPDVKFHNGEPFTAEDVAFSIERIPSVPNSPSAFTPYLRGITAVKVIDPLTVHLITDGPAPLVPVQLRMIFMLNKKTHENRSTNEFNSGDVAVGTGAFKFASFTVNEELRVTRNDDYWGEKPDWTEVRYRAIVAEAPRTSAILAGDVDVIGDVPGGDLARLSASPNIEISSAESRRFNYICLNFAPDSEPPQMSDHAGAPLPENPFRDLRVRQALSLAIDRAAICSRLLDDMAVPAFQPAPANSYGHAGDVIVPAQDLEAAKALLAEAGYPDGFKLTLSTPNDTIPKGPEVAQAIAQMWARIGVAVTVHAEPGGPLKTQSDSQQLSAWLSTLIASGGEPSPILVSGVASFNRERGRGSYNGGRYSNAEIDAKIDEALQSLDEAEREDIFKSIARILAADLGIIPLYTPKIAWAVRSGYRYAARADGYSVVQDVSPR